MLAKKIIEDNLLPFMAQEAPDVENDGEQISQKVITKSSLSYKLPMHMFVFMCKYFLFLKLLEMLHRVSQR